MTILLFILLILAVLAGLYVLSVRGRSGEPGLAELRSWRYAHRGLHSADRPENSMSAFRAALERGYGIELDVHLLKDGNLAVIHDSLLARTTGAEGRVEELNTEELKNYRLGGTEETIPTFRQVLELFRGQAPLIVELKSTAHNYAQLAETACQMLADYKGAYCIESFDPRCIYWLRKNRPQVIRGQLAENFLAGSGKMPWVLKFLLTCQLENFLLLPDFVAYKFADRKTLSNTVVRRLWGIQGVAWTLKTPAELNAAEQEGWLPIFEGFEP